MGKVLPWHIAGCLLLVCIFEGVEFGQQDVTGWVVLFSQELDSFVDKLVVVGFVIWGFFDGVESGGAG